MSEARTRSVVVALDARDEKRARAFARASIADGSTYGMRGSDEERNRTYGAYAEVAFEKLSGLAMSEEVGSKRLFDFVLPDGRTLDVKGRPIYADILPASPERRDESRRTGDADLYALARVDLATRTVEFVGYCTRAEMYRPENYLDWFGRGPTYGVEDWTLDDIRDLVES